MIVKKVLFKNQTKSSFKKLAEYALDVENNNAKVLVDYMLDKNNEMEKVEAYNFTNCSFENDQDNIDEILNTQKLNTTSKQDKTMHLIVSFQEDERPSIETLNTIEKEIAIALRMEHHQRLSVVHSNTNNLHIHIAINKVDPVTLKVKNPYNDVGILQEAAIKLEKKYNLKVDNHISQNEKAENKYNIHSMTANFENWVKNKLTDEIDLLLKNENTTFENIQELLAKYDLEFRERRKGFVISSKSDKLFCKASSIHRDLSKQQLEKRFDNLELNPNIETVVSQKFNKFEGMPPNPLWKQYQKEEALKKLELDKELKYIKLRRNEFKNSISSMKFNKQTFNHIKNQRMIFKNQTAEIYKKYKRRSYRDFLLYEAFNKQNENAIKTLQYRDSKFSKDDNVLKGSINDKISVFDNPHYVTKEGYFVYQNERDKIIDKKDHIKVVYDKYNNEDNSEKAILKSLQMAMKKYDDITINGDTGFKDKIVKVAVKYDLDIKFKDNSLNRMIREQRTRGYQVEQSKDEGLTNF